LFGFFAFQRFAGALYEALPRSSTVPDVLPEPGIDGESDGEVMRSLSFKKKNILESD
jgi:hypothetical protein